MKEEILTYTKEEIYTLALEVYPKIMLTAHDRITNAPYDYDYNEYARGVWIDGFTACESRRLETEQVWKEIEKFPPPTPIGKILIDESVLEELNETIKQKEEHLQKYNDAIECLARNKDKMIFLQGDSCAECDEFDRKISELKSKL